MIAFKKEKIYSKENKNWKHYKYILINTVYNYKLLIIMHLNK